MDRRPSVITVGNFDGVHLGHRALLRAAREEAMGYGAAVVAVTFERHPLTRLKPEAAPPALMDGSQREAALREAGADRVAWLPVSGEVLGLSPRAFVEKMVGEHGPVAWVEGPDFRFGKKRAGDMEMLRAFGEEMGFGVRVVKPVEVTLRDKLRAPASSSLVRWLVAHGRMADAELCMEQPFAVRGRVVEGERRGREIGFPTVNLALGEDDGEGGPPGRLLPADGVYAGTAEVEGIEYAAAISVGIKPTFGEQRRVFEAYLLDFAGDLYDRTVEVKVHRWLRDQIPYPDVETLIGQMRRDVDRTRRLRENGLLSAARQVARAAG